MASLNNLQPGQILHDYQFTLYVRGARDVATPAEYAAESNVLAADSGDI